MGVLTSCVIMDPLPIPSLLQASTRCHTDTPQPRYRGKLAALLQQAFSAACHLVSPFSPHRSLGPPLTPGTAEAAVPAGGAGTGTGVGMNAARPQPFVFDSSSRSTILRTLLAVSRQGLTERESPDQGTTLSPVSTPVRPTNSLHTPRFSLPQIPPHMLSHPCRHLPDNSDGCVVRSAGMASLGMGTVE